jgi:hypothetical protein
MAKLNITQRRYILSQILRQAQEQLEKKYRKAAQAGDGTSFVIRIQNRVPSVEESGLDVRTEYLLRKDTCLSLDRAAAKASKEAYLPDSWYKAEYDAERFTVYTEMEECMSKPRVTIEFHNEAKAIKTLRNKVRREFGKNYEKQAELLSEARYDVMEFNKWFKKVAVPKTMLVSEGEQLLDELKKSMPV